MSRPARGEVWWGEAPDERGRPYLVVSRDQAIPVLRTIMVAPVTRTMRAIPTEIPLGPPEGLRTECAATMDNALAFPKAMLTDRMGSLGPERAFELCDAWRAVADC